MFFLLRSAFCITAVVLALPVRTPLSEGTLARSGVETARDLCRADSRRCAAVLNDGIATLLALDLQTTAMPTRPSVDTLRPDDLRHAWMPPGTSSRR